jgi:MSHA type pilus biogenesis protein MshL
MKYVNNILLCSSLLLLALLFVACTPDSKKVASDAALAPAASPQAAIEPQPAAPPPPLTLPVRYQTASYFVDKEEQEVVTLAEETRVKVGARITSTSGPQPLWDILKRLAALKGMNVSWASDVDRNVLVDVNIGANDDFYLAIDNLLRQVDYYHEVEGTTIIVKYKETRQFHIAMPFIKQTYKTNTGGDVLGGSSGGESNTNIAGEISLSTEGAAIDNLRDGKPGGIEFNTWSSIENNLNTVLNVWSTDEITATDTNQDEAQNVNRTTGTTTSNAAVDSNIKQKQVSATFRRSSAGNTYFIDKPIGLITVTAPRPILDRLDLYFKALKEQLYKQISIEAKIIEVQIDDHSAIGLNWNQLLNSLSVAGGQAALGQTYNKTSTDGSNSASSSNRDYSSSSISTRTRDTSFDGLDDSNTASTNVTGVVSNLAGSVASAGVSAATIITEGFSGSIGGALSLAAFTFDSFIKAVDEQGQSQILSNPKLSVLNGQPALMTVGRNVTYIDSITSDTDGTTGTITYTAETARALSGVGLALTANILDNNEIILNLVPVTSELVEPIQYRQIGLGEVGLPIINVREMSTTVRVKNGEMLVIGGLISSSSSNSDSFIPGTKKIPFLKYLFGYEEKTERKRELIILLQPRII